MAARADLGWWGQRGVRGSVAEGVQGTELFMSCELDISLLRVFILGTQSEVYGRISCRDINLSIMKNLGSLGTT